MFKKGQAAMEFLMTYGWAILVVLAAIGALAYFGVLNPGQLLPDKCTFPASFDCVDKPVVNFDTGIVQLAIRNDVGYPIDTIGGTLTGDGDCATIGTLTVVDATNGSIDYTGTTDMQPGARAVVQFTCGGGTISGDFESDVQISYVNTETTLTHNARGELRAKRP
mgnify:CR=1 FL=1|jgi:hypothetical protein